eukprot:maker-scaffold_6-snap-gene-20.58-mRNA-1 protein AED:0.05 eAED:0.05 QI:57/1/1/1/1/1/4/105/188
MSKKVLIPIANGSEDIESTTIIDTLRRAGLDVTVGVVGDSETVVLARGLKVVGDVNIKQIMDKDFDLIALPGGIPGATNLKENQELQALMKKQLEKSEGKYLAAICASPCVVFDGLSLLPEGTIVTCHPSFEKKLTRSKYSNERVVVSGNIVTSQGPGTTLEFSIKLIELLLGKEKADEVKAPMIAHF